VDPIKINGGTTAVSRSTGSDTDEHKPKTESAPNKQSDAVAFNKSKTALHQAFNDAVENVESAQAERVAKIREAIIDGTYEPDLKVVAERLLIEMDKGKNG
jgi:flagellar biosynthesis anti-sigma factor FlgM